MLKYFKELYERGLTPRHSPINSYFWDNGPGRFFGCDDEFLDTLVALVGNFESQKMLNHLEESGVVFEERLDDDCTKDRNSWMRDFREQFILPSISERS